MGNTGAVQHQADATSSSSMRRTLNQLMVKNSRGSSNSNSNSSAAISSTSTSTLMTSTSISASSEKEVERSSSLEVFNEPSKVPFCEESVEKTKSISTKVTQVAAVVSTADEDKDKERNDISKKYNLIKLRHQDRSTITKQLSEKTSTDCYMDNCSSDSAVSDSFVTGLEPTKSIISFEYLYGFEVFHPSIGFGIIRHIYRKSEAEVWCQISCQDGRVEELLLHKGGGSSNESSPSTYPPPHQSSTSPSNPTSSFSSRGSARASISHTENMDETVHVVFIAKIL